MTYIDIFVAPVAKERLADYKTIAEIAAQVWYDHGALSYVEVEADDAKPGQWTSFPQSVDLKDGEVVIVAIIGYRDRAHRDEVNAKAMKDQRMANMDAKTMPFDGKRMFWGGFKPLVGVMPAALTAIRPYVFFRGRCEEAIAYYKATLGAEVRVMMRFKDNPEKPPCDSVPANLDERIMHAEIVVAGATLMMSDGMKSDPPDYQSVSLSLSVPTIDDADRIFTALAADGTIQMPMGPTFFARRFGAVADKFGVSWMIVVM